MLQGLSAGPLSCLPVCWILLSLKGSFQDSTFSVGRPFMRSGYKAGFESAHEWRPTLLSRRCARCPLVGGKGGREGAGRKRKRRRRKAGPDQRRGGEIQAPGVPGGRGEEPVQTCPEAAGLIRLELCCERRSCGPAPWRRPGEVWGWEPGGGKGGRSGGDPRSESGEREACFRLSGSRARADLLFLPLPLHPPFK